MQLLIVRRGLLSTFKWLTDQFANEPEIQIMWDRRRGADAGEPSSDGPVSDSAQGERRKPHDPRWISCGYLVVSTRQDGTASGNGSGFGFPQHSA